MQQNALNDLKRIIRFPNDYPVAKRMAAKVDDPSRPTVTIRLTTDALLIDAARHLASIAIGCDRVGYNVALTCSSLRLATIGRKTYGRMFLGLGNVSWQSLSKPTRSRCWSDTPHEHSRLLCVGRHVLPDADPMPYPRHPRIESLNQPLAKLRASKRDCGVFFGGNTKASYGRSEFANYQGLLNRLQVIEVAKSLRCHAITLRDVNSDPIATDQWLATVARANFFLCPPGSSQPICHHLAEALSVGTIPILQYGDLVDPSLYKSGGAIGFNDASTLRRALHQAVAMPPKEIERRRQSAIEFYDRHFDHGKFIALMLAKTSKRPIAMRFHHVDFLKTLCPIAA